MSVSQLSASTQNYLKAIWIAKEWSDAPVTPTVLAEKTGVRLSSASDAIKKLADQGLVDHKPYGEVTLTDEGATYAVEMVRRHRLIETFLVEALGYLWDEVHEEADTLEHAVSDTMVDRMDKFLGYPSRDPHGDPIPRADGTVTPLNVVRLSQMKNGESGRVERISDGDPAMLQYFAAEGLSIDTDIRIADSLPYSGSLQVVLDGKNKTLSLGLPATDAVWVSLNSQS